MFKYETMIKIYDVDAAGVLFFANQFRLVYDAYEAFLNEIGFPVQKIINESSFLLPVVSAKPDYKAPLYVGDVILINIDVKDIGDSSITLSHQIYKDSKILVGEGETVHVSIDKTTSKKMKFPQDLIEAIDKKL
jgi:1,4-dihydroxy-2-naphthoyl-CoA hydrolase